MEEGEERGGGGMEARGMISIASPTCYHLKRRSGTHWTFLSFAE